MQALEYIPVLGIEHDSIVDGDGIREVLFVAGCPHRCEGCHNPESWDWTNYKEMMHPYDLFDELTSNPLAEGITLSGGEPMMYAKQLLPLVQRIKAETDLTIWCWSGWTYEQLTMMKHTNELLKYIDVLVDGKFINELRDITENNMYRGSLNQRVLKLEDGVVVEELYPNGYKG